MYNVYYMYTYNLLYRLIDKIRNRSIQTTDVFRFINIALLVEKKLMR